jgi:hypothetical protein
LLHLLLSSFPFPFQNASHATVAAKVVLLGAVVVVVAAAVVREESSGKLPFAVALKVMLKRSSKPRRAHDPNQLGKPVLDMITGEAAVVQIKRAKNQAAVALGRLGGKKGGKARAAKLSPEERVRIAQLAASKRWSAKSSTSSS